MENERPPEGFKFSKVMNPNKDELKPSANNVNIGIMRTDIETMIQQIKNGSGKPEVMRAVASFYDLLLRTYELELRYLQTPKDSYSIDFFEDRG
jgi:hypothetical protein